MEKTPEKRRSRYSRARTKGSFVLQERDRRIIAAVYQYRFLTRSQIQRLFDIPCVTRVNNRLRKLFDQGFLDRRFRSAVLGNTEATYIIGLRGIPIVAEEFKKDPLEIARRRRQNFAVKDHLLEHDLLLNDIRICLIKEIQSASGLELAKWLEPRCCEHRFQVTKAGRQITSSLRPDGYCQIIREGKLYSFFIELDRSTSNLKTLQSKFELYRDFKTLGLYEQAFGLRAFQVLIFVKSDERLANLKALTDSMGFDIFWFIKTTQALKGMLFASIWARSQSNEIRSLLKCADAEASP